MKKLTSKNLIFFLFIFLCGNLKAQNIDFHLTNATTPSYNLEDIQKINYSGTTMNLHLLDASIYSWDVTEINWINFNSNTTHLEQLIHQVNEWELNVFPNPAQSEINVSFNSLNDENVTLILFDITGCCVFEKSIGNITNGKTTELIQLPNLNDGMYILKIKGKTRTCSKQILIKN
jgi:hypothetical protein